MDDVVIAAVTSGDELKRRLVAELEQRGHGVRELSVNTAPHDHVSVTHALAREISEGRAPRGVLLCGSGLGTSYVANTYPHVRAAVIWSPEVAELARRQGDANIAILPARFLSVDEMTQIVQQWLEASPAPASGELAPTERSNA